MSENNIIFKLHDGRELSASIRRSARARHLNLRRHAISSLLTLTVPHNLPFSEIQALAQQFVPWLEKTFTNSGPAPRIELPNLVSVPILDRCFAIKTSPDFNEGKKCRKEAKAAIVVKKDAQKIIVLENDDNITLYGNIEDNIFAIVTLQAFFRHLAEQKLPGHLNCLYGRGNQNLIEVRIRDQRTRWGSCSVRNFASVCIYLNWRAILLPLHLLNHLCWHELTHLKAMNHSPAFYSELEKKSPNWREYEKLLSAGFKYLPAWTYVRI